MTRTTDSSELVIAGVLVLAATALYLPLAAEGAPAASSLAGHTLGVLGFLLMLGGTLGYSWRKRTGAAGPGPMRRWLEGHVVAGIAGPYLILLHGSFGLRGLAGVTTLLVLTVVASGVVGRYAFTAVPRPAPGASHADEEDLEREVARLEGTGGVALAAPPQALRDVVAARRRLAACARERERRRRRLALWWLLHVPLAAAMFALGLVHALAALYYATLSR